MESQQELKFLSKNCKKSLAQFHIFTSGKYPFISTITSIFDFVKWQKSGRNVAESWQKDGRSVSVDTCYIGIVERLGDGKA